MAMKIHHNIKVLALLILIVLSATGIDWIVHQLDEAYAVPPEYFSNKIIYATIWGIVGLIVFRKQNHMGKKAALLSLFIATVLQAKYYLQGYNLFFVTGFIFVHFIAFFFPMLIVFETFPELFSENPRPDSNSLKRFKDPFSKFRRPGKPGQ